MCQVQKNTVNFVCDDHRKALKRNSVVGTIFSGSSKKVRFKPVTELAHDFPWLAEHNITVSGYVGGEDFVPTVLEDDVTVLDDAMFDIDTVAEFLLGEGTARRELNAATVYPAQRQKDGVYERF